MFNNFFKRKTPENFVNENIDIQNKKFFNLDEQRVAIKYNELNKNSKKNRTGVISGAVITLHARAIVMSTLNGNTVEELYKKQKNNNNTNQTLLEFTKAVLYFVDDLNNNSPMGKLRIGYNNIEYIGEVKTRCEKYIELLEGKINDENEIKRKEEAEKEAIGKTKEEAGKNLANKWEQKRKKDSIIFEKLKRMMDIYKENQPSVDYDKLKYENSDKKEKYEINLIKMHEIIKTKPSYFNDWHTGYKNNHDESLPTLNNFDDVFKFFNDVVERIPKLDTTDEREMYEISNKLHEEYIKLDEDIKKYIFNHDSSDKFDFEKFANAFILWKKNEDINEDKRESYYGLFVLLLNHAKFLKEILDKIPTQGGKRRKRSTKRKTKRKTKKTKRKSKKTKTIRKRH